MIHLARLHEPGAKTFEHFDTAVRGRRGLSNKQEVLKVANILFSFDGALEMFEQVRNGLISVRESDGCNAVESVFLHPSFPEVDCGNELGLLSGDDRLGTIFL